VTDYKSFRNGAKIGYVFRPGAWKRSMGKRGKKVKFGENSLENGELFGTFSLCQFCHNCIWPVQSPRFAMTPTPVLLARPLPTAKIRKPLGTSLGTAFVSMSLSTSKVGYSGRSSWLKLRGGEWIQ